MEEWNTFVDEKREEELQTIIQEERLKPKETRAFMNQDFKEGEVRTYGVVLDNMLLAMPRFGVAAAKKRAEKKQTVIDRIKVFFDKFFGIGRKKSFEEETEEQKKGYTILSAKQEPMAAEIRTPYGKV